MNTYYRTAMAGITGWTANSPGTKNRNDQDQALGGAVEYRRGRGGQTGVKRWGWVGGRRVGVGAHDEREEGKGTRGREQWGRTVRGEGGERQSRRLKGPWKKNEGGYNTRGHRAEEE